MNYCINRAVSISSDPSLPSATYEAAFNWYKRQLALVGIVTSKKFRDVINSIRVKKCTDQKTALEAKREAERKAKKNKPPPRT